MILLLLAFGWHVGDRVCVWNSHFRSGCDYEIVRRVEGDQVWLPVKSGTHTPITVVNESIPQDRCPPDQWDLTVWRERVVSYNGCKAK